MENSDLHLVADFLDRLATKGDIEEEMAQTWAQIKDNSLVQKFLDSLASADKKDGKENEKKQTGSEGDQEGSQEEGCSEEEGLETSSPSFDTRQYEPPEPSDPPEPQQIERIITRKDITKGKIIWDEASQHYVLVSGKTVPSPVRPKKAPIEEILQDQGDVQLFAEPFVSEGIEYAKNLNYGFIDEPPIDEESLPEVRWGDPLQWGWKQAQGLGRPGEPYTPSDTLAEDGIDSNETESETIEYSKKEPKLAFGDSENNNSGWYDGGNEDDESEGEDCSNDDDNGSNDDSNDDSDDGEGNDE
jgi:hypothetical protein